VAVLRQRIGTRHHEQGPVHLEHHIESIGVRGVERVTREDFVGDEKGERTMSQENVLPTNVLILSMVSQ